MLVPRVLMSSVWGTSQMGWRLLSANNRPLGCGVMSYDGAVACAEVVTGIQEQASRLVGIQALDLANGRWVWRVELAGEPIAAACRAYDAQRENQASLRAFLIAFELAPLAVDARTIVLPPQRRVLDLRDIAPPGAESLR